MTYVEWLTSEKNYSLKTARDIACRLRRVQSLLGVSHIDIDSILKLKENNNYQSFSKYVKAQLKRSIVLFCEYESFQLTNK